MGWMIFGALVLFILLVSLWQGKHPGVTALDYTNAKLPAAFDGFRILHVSDFHNTRFGDRQNRLMSLIRLTKPDMVVITGDLLDRRHPDRAVVMDFVRRLRPLAPIYYVSGNHELRSGYYDTLLPDLAREGVAVLDDRLTAVEHNGALLTLCGLKDPYDTGTEVLDKQLGRLMALAPADRVTILLCHRPELLDVYASHDVDLVFTGHAHGGLVRIPGILKGLIAPHQGFFPKYTAGAYTKDGTTMIVSRGLGTNLMPMRVGNPPELVLTVLHNHDNHDYHDGKNKKSGRKS